MARNPTYSIAGKNLALNALLDTANGGFIAFYGFGSGQPAGPDVAVTDQILSVTLALSATAFAPASGGFKTANAITPALISTTVDVRWYRIYKADGTTGVHDGTVGTIDQTCDLTVGTTFFVAGVTLTVPSLIITVPLEGSTDMSLQTWQETLVNATVDGAAITAAAATSCIPTASKITLPNNYFYVGRMLRITASGRISSVITTPGTARFDIRLGAVVAFDSQAILLDSVAAHTNVGWKLDILLTCRSIGSGTASTLFGQGTWTCEDILGVPATAPKGVLAAILPWNAAPAVGTGFDSTAANTLDMFFTQTVATGSMTLHQFCVESLNLPAFSPKGVSSCLASGQPVSEGGCPLSVVGA